MHTYMHTTRKLPRLQRGPHVDALPRAPVVTKGSTIISLSLSLYIYIYTYRHIYIYIYIYVYIYIYIYVIISLSLVRDCPCA